MCEICLSIGVMGNADLDIEMGETKAASAASVEVYDGHLMWIRRQCGNTRTIVHNTP